MRGNEIPAPFGGVRRLDKLLIPMRGNETMARDGLISRDAVTDPHEG